MTQKVQQYILWVPSKSFISINNEKIEVFDVEILELNSSNPVVKYSITTGHPRSCIQKISKVAGLGGAMLTQRRK